MSTLKYNHKCIARNCHNIVYNIKYPIQKIRKIFMNLCDISQADLISLLLTFSSVVVDIISNRQQVTTAWGNVDSMTYTKRPKFLMNTLESLFYLVDKCLIVNPRITNLVNLYSTIYCVFFQNQKQAFIFSRIFVHSCSLSS